MEQNRMYRSTSGYDEPIIYVKAMRPNEPIIALFESRIDIIQHDLDQEGIPWAAIELFNASRDGLSYRPSLIIGIKSPKRQQIPPSDKSGLFIPGQLGPS